MSRDAFELVALTMRYVVAALMALIVIRAARGALVDSRRAAKLRRLSPMTGVSGELVVLDPIGRLPRGMRFPVIREGMIGVSRRADIRIRHNSVRRRHLLFQLTEAGLHIRTHAGTRLRDGLGAPARELMLLDGDSFFAGDVHLMLVLSVPDLPRRPMRVNYGESDLPESPETEAPDDLFDVDELPDEPEIRRGANCDPISPIFEAERDPFDAPPRRQRRHEDPQDLWAQPRREKKKRQFLIDDELFDTDDKF